MFKSNAVEGFYMEITFGLEMRSSKDFVSLIHLPVCTRGKKNPETDLTQRLTLLKSSTFI